MKHELSERLETLPNTRQVRHELKSPASSALCGQAWEMLLLLRREEMQTKEGLWFCLFFF